jgi:hypothetical protein
MFFLFINVFCFFIKLYFLFVTISKRFDKIIKLFLVTIMSYDMALDIAFIFIMTPEISRPYWFNIFMGTGMILFFGKTIAIKKIIDFLINKDLDRSKVAKTYEKIGFFVGFTQFVTYLFIFIKNDFTRKIIVTANRYYFELLLTKFSAIFLHFLIILPSIKKLNIKIKDLDLSPLYRNNIKYFLYYWILPKFLIDSIQISAMNLLIYVISDNRIFSSIISHKIINELMQFACISSTFLFYIIQKFINYMSFLEHISDVKNIIFKYSEYPTYRDMELIFEDRKLNIYEESDSPLQDIISKSCIRTISEDLEIHDNYVAVELDLLYRSQYKKEILDDDILSKFLDEHDFINLDQICDYIYFKNLNVDCSKYIEVRNRLKKIGVRIIVSWKDKKKIVGMIVIKISPPEYYKYISIDQINYLFKMRLHIKNIQDEIKNKVILNLMKFKTDLMNKRISKLIKTQEEAIINLYQVIGKIKIGFCFFSKKKSIWINKPKNNYIEIENEIEKINPNKIDQIVLPLQEETFILQPFSEIIKKNFYSVGYTHIPMKDIYTRPEKTVLYFTEIGKKINNIIVSDEIFILKYKEKILSICQGIDPLVLISSQYSIFLLEKIIAIIGDIFFINVSYAELFDIDSFYELFRNKNIDIFNDFFNQSKKKIFIILNQFNDLERYIQKRIIEKYIDYYMKLENTNFKINIIIPIESPYFVSSIDDSLIKISTILDLDEPTIQELFKDNFEKILISILNEILGRQFTIDQFERIKESLKKSMNYNWRLSDIVFFIEQELKKEDETLFLKDIVTEFEINEVLDQASKLGRMTLKNKNLMFKLAKIYNNNMSDISKLIGVNKSSVSRFFKKYDE